uniref:WD_REPEATS_REGION domain-containing protein n=1 Tax=Caenorhabditis tropicalis TaxID=1561998 RepID=A0A1I7TUU6_9PELO
MTSICPWEAAVKLEAIDEIDEEQKLFHMSLKDEKENMDPLLDVKSIVKEAKMRMKKPKQIPFVGTHRSVEKPAPNLYGCAFNQFIESRRLQCAAAVGGAYIFIYYFPKNRINKSYTLKLEQPYKEDLYQVTWCLDNHDFKIVAGGETGKLYVIDYDEMDIDRELIGTGGSINEIRTSPVNPTMIAVASADTAIRVFDIRSPTCLLILGGRRGHRDSVLSLDWSPDGMRLMTGSFDHRVMMWDLSGEIVQRHFKICQYDLKSDGKIRKFNFYFGDRRLQAARRVFDLEDHSMYIVTPMRLVDNLHFDSVDCVRFYGDYCFSRSAGHDSHIRFWRFGAHEQEKIGSGVVKMVQKQVPFGHPWFSKFAVDPCNQFLATGGHGGIMHIYDMTDNTLEPMRTCVVGKKEGMTRQVAFSNDGHFIFAVGDCGSIARMNRVDPHADGAKIKDTWKK